MLSHLLNLLNDLKYVSSCHD